MNENRTLVDALRAHYGAAARTAATGTSVVGDSCWTVADRCGPGNDCCGPSANAAVGEFGAACYDTAELAELPAEAWRVASAAPTRWRWRRCSPVTLAATLAPA